MAHLDLWHDLWWFFVGKHFFRLRKQRNCGRERKLKLNGCLTWRRDKSKDCKKSVNHRERSLVAPVWCWHNSFCLLSYVLCHIWYYFFLLPVEWRIYTAKGAVSGRSKKGTWRYGKEIRGYDFNIACPRHLCWRWWGMPCLTDIVSP